MTPAPSPQAASNSHTSRSWWKIPAAVLLLEVLLCSLHWSWQRSRVLPPEVNLEGYPANTRRVVEQAYRRIEKLTDPSAQDWDRLGDTLSASGRYAEAVSCYRHAAQCAPTAAEYLYDLAFCLMSTGQLQEADETFAAATKLEPQLQDTQHYFAGVNALRRGDAVTAKLSFERSDLAASRLQLAILALEDSNPERCRDLLSKIPPAAYRVQQLLSAVEQANGQPEAARRRMLLTDHLDGIVTGPWNERAAIIVARTEAISPTAQKLKELERLPQDPVGVAKRISSDQSQIWEPELEDLLADAALAAGDRDAHITHLKTLIQRDGPSTYRMNRLGIALVAGGQSAKGQAVLEMGHRLLGTATPEVAADNCLALAELTADVDPPASRGYRAKASRLLRDYEASLKIDDQQADLWFQLGLRLERIAAGLLPGDARSSEQLTKSAITAYEKCLRLEPNHQSAGLMRNALRSARAAP